MLVHLGRAAPPCSASERLDPPVHTTAALPAPCMAAVNFLTFLFPFRSACPRSSWEAS